MTRILRTGLAAQFFGLRAQVLLWTVLPLTILLIIFSVTGVQGHQEAMRSLATQEHSQLVLTFAQLIALELENRSLVDNIGVEQVPATDLNLDQWLSMNHPVGDSAVILLDEDTNILFQWGSLLPIGNSREWLGVSEALAGQHSVVFTSETMHGEIVAYAPIPSRRWALIIRESWHALAAPLIRYEQVLPFILFIALATSSLILFFGLRYVVQPLRELSLRAARIGQGEFDATRVSAKGVREIEDLRQSLNEMADQVRNYQASLHDYVGAVDRAQEEERARLSRELHDETVQSLIALGHKAQMLQRTLAKAPEKVSEYIQEMRQMIAQAIEETRLFSRALHPHYLDELGLVPALKNLAQDANAAFVVNGVVPRLKPDCELVIYRIAQEALNNAVRHADAKTIRVEYSFEGRRSTLKISDDGKGFDLPTHPTSFTRTGHFGLFGMRERAMLVGGHLSIISARDKGTQVTFSV